VVEGTNKFDESLDDVDYCEREMLNENFDNGGRERAHGDRQIVNVVYKVQKKSFVWFHCKRPQVFRRPWGYVCRNRCWS
jgi:hypothetical protein